MTLDDDKSMQTTLPTQSEMDPQAIKERILEIARDYCNRGPGWAQEGVVLHEVAERLGIAGDKAVERQQLILTCWHDLFREGILSWGYNLDNPSNPWFHLRVPRNLP
jgi:hypothetical protein